ncbi:hypothetical protein NFI96_015373 [Prochilodus magdalenae]|nr:hypothetical protein NFI96_015373 [Prochilodus magdalenae]
MGTLWIVTVLLDGDFWGTGLVVLCLVFTVWTAGLCYSKHKGHNIYNKALYQEYVLEETDNFVDMELKELAKEDAKAPAKDRLKKIKKELNCVTGEKVNNVN